MDPISKTMEKHFEAIDVQMDEMISNGFSHESIHQFRESIRQLRALLLYYQPVIRTSDYRELELISKNVFNMTSLIREIDVFENGYYPYMNPQTMYKLATLKKPLLLKLKEDIENTKSFKFKNYQLHIKSDEHIGSERMVELYQTLVEHCLLAVDNEEKNIHNKRMLAKKIRYIHDLLIKDRIALVPINVELDAFQDCAKKLHDVCVNLRFIGHYQLNDQGLINKLVEDHATSTKNADKQFEKLCGVLSHFIEK